MSFSAQSFSERAPVRDFASPNLNGSNSLREQTKLKTLAKARIVNLVYPTG